MELGKPAGKKSYNNTYLNTIRTNVARNPDGASIINDDRKETWAETWGRSNQFANALLGIGLKKSDRVLIYLPNCFEYFEIFLSITKAGLILTTANFRLTAKEIAYQLNDSGASVVIITNEQYENIKAIRDQVPELKHIIMIGDNVPEGVLSYSELISSGSVEEPDVDVQPDDISMLLYTSGTTGNPKGAVRTHRCDYHSIISICMEMGLKSEDVQLIVTPLYAAGSIGFMGATLISNGSIVVVPSFSPELVLQYIDKFKPTWMWMVPVMYDWIFLLPKDVLEKYDISSVRMLITAGAPVNRPTVLKIMDYFKNAEVMNWLGSTECSFVSSLNYKNGMKEKGCVGKATFETELKLLSTEGKEVKKGELGVLYSRGPGTFEGYWNKPEGTREAFFDHEWATVGDIARMDQDDNYYLVDRAKDLIISGGTNVYPAEIEEVLSQNDAISESAVIGVPDEKWGEAVKAVVVLKAGYDVGEQEIIDFCRKELAGFKVPKSVDFVEKIPRSIVGKALKKDLRKKYWEGHDSEI